MGAAAVGAAAAGAYYRGGCGYDAYGNWVCPGGYRAARRRWPMVLEADDDYDHVASGHSAVAGWRPNSTYFCMCEQAGTPELYDDDLTKAQASKRIDEMREKANVT